MEKNATTEDMKTLSSCLNKLVREGYEEDFKVTKNELCGVHGKKSYQPEEVRIVDFFRFEGASDPADNSILYAIETDDGTKGTLTDAYGAYADVNVDKFIKQVGDINNKAAAADNPASKDR
jgi:hypothetical protein